MKKYIKDEYLKVSPFLLIFLSKLKNKKPHNKQGKEVFKSYCLPTLSLLCVVHMVPEALQELPICFDFCKLVATSYIALLSTASAKGGRQ